MTKALNRFRRSLLRCRQTDGQTDRHTELAWHFCRPDAARYVEYHNKTCKRNTLRSRREVCCSITKCRSTADHRVAAVGKLFTLIALAGVVAVARRVAANGADL